MIKYLLSVATILVVSFSWMYPACTQETPPSQSDAFETVKAKSEARDRALERIYVGVDSKSQPEFQVKALGKIELEGLLLVRPISDLTNYLTSESIAVEMLDLKDGNSSDTLETFVRDLKLLNVKALTLPTHPWKGEQNRIKVLAGENASFDKLTELVGAFTKQGFQVALSQLLLNDPIAPSNSGTAASVGANPKSSPTQTPVGLPSKTSVELSDPKLSEVLPQLQAQMLIIKSDWSKAANPKVLEEDLRWVLRDLDIDSELMANLPTHGRSIIFPPELVSYYSRSDANDLINWLKSRQLLFTTEDNPSERSQLEFQKFELTQINGIPIRQSSLTLPYDTKTLPDLPRKAVSNAMVTQHPSWTWKITYSRQDNSPGQLEVWNKLILWEQLRGKNEQSEKETLDQSEAAFIPPQPGEVAVISGFSAGSRSSLGEQIRASGRECLLFIAVEGGPALSDKSKPRLALPLRVERPIVSWGRRTMFNTPTGMGMGMGTMAGGPSRGSSRGSGDAFDRGRSPVSSFFGSRNTGTPNNMTSTPDLELRSFSLKYSQAKSMYDLLQQLFSNESTNIAVDERTNTLIVRGKREILDQIEAVLIKADMPDDGEQDLGPNSTEGSPSPLAARASTFQKAGAKVSISTDHLRRTYQSLEAKSIEIALALRNIAHQTDKSDPKRQRLHADLDVTVNAAFIARQNLLRAEVNELQQKINRIQQSLQTRDRLQQAIIKHRIDDLLNPQLEWESKSPSTSQTRPPPPKLGSTAVPSKQVATTLPGNVPSHLTEPLTGISANRDLFTTPGPTKNIQSAVVWIEAILGTSDPKKPGNSSATYLNGIYVSPDGLIATCLPREVTLAKPGQLVVRCVVFAPGTGQVTQSARLVELEPESRLALFKSDLPPGMNVPFLEVSSEFLVRNQKLQVVALHGMTLNEIENCQVVVDQELLAAIKEVEPTNSKSAEALDSVNTQPLATSLRLFSIVDEVRTGLQSGDQAGMPLIARNSMVQGIYVGSTSPMQRVPTIQEFQNPNSIDPSLLAEDANRPTGSGGFSFGVHPRSYRVCVSANLIHDLIRRYQTSQTDSTKNESKFNPM